MYLLGAHEKVSLPGWGSFLQTGRPGYYDPEEEAFYPRSYAVEFRPESEGSPAVEQVGFTQQLLIDYISSQRKIAIEEAEKLYRAAFDFHQQELEQSGQTHLSGIGLLTVGSQGLSLKSPPETEGAGWKPVMVRELPTLTPEGLNHEVEFESNDRREGARYWWGAAVGILLLGVAFVAIKPNEVYHFLKNRGVELPILTRLAGDSPEMKETVTPSIVSETEDPQGRENAHLLADSLLMESEDLTADSLQGLVATASEEPTAHEDQPRVTYEIIVGSFRTMEQANSFVEEMAQKDIEVWAIDSRMPANRKKVSCASFPTEAEAYRALREIQRTIEPGAWVARVER